MSYNIYKNNNQLLPLHVSFKEAKEQLDKLKQKFIDNKADIVFDSRSFIVGKTEYEIRKVKI